MSRVSLKLYDGTELNKFESYSIKTSMRSLASTFMLTIKIFGNEYKELFETLKEHPEVKLFVDGTQQLVGRVGDINIGQDRSQGSWINISGEDLLGCAAKSSIPRGFSAANLSIKESLEKLLEPWNISVINSNDTNIRLISQRHVITEEEKHFWNESTKDWKIEKTKKEFDVTVKDDRPLVPQPGQNIGSWIQLILERHKYLGWLSATGELVICRPNYNQDPIPQITVGTIGNGEGAVKRAELVYVPIDISTNIEVAGRIGRKGSAKFSTQVTNDELIASGWYKYTLEVDDELRDQSKGQDKALRIKHDEWFNGWNWKCTINGHSANNFLPCTDLVVHCIHPALDIDENLYCIERVFQKSKAGTTAQLTFALCGLL